MTQCSLSFIRQYTSSAQEIPEKYGEEDFTIVTIKAFEQNLYQQKKQCKFRLLSCCSWMHSPVPVPIIAKHKALMEK